MRWFARIAVVAHMLASAVVAGEPKQRAPSSDAKGEIYEWKAADGLAYQYFVPKDYDKKAGANLLLILHGSNLDRRWGFANHPAGQFRARDIVVCPDGTTSNGSGGFNFMQSEQDVSRLSALHAELKKLFEVKATYVYGHSQGSFFALLYAGEHPDDVDGVVAQASGMWIGTKLSSKHHHQAIALMHGTADPVVPYFQSVGALEEFQKAEYPNCRLRSLIDWNHWPDANQTGQLLAWCEGVSTKDPAAVDAAFDDLLAVHEAVDVVSRYFVAQRIVKEAACTAAHKDQARKFIAKIDAAVAAHVAAIDKAMKDKNAWKLETAPPWIAYARRFAREYQSVPACEKFRASYADKVAQHVKDAAKAWKDYSDALEKKDSAGAFAAGVDMVAKCFLADGYVTTDFLATLKKMKDDAKKLKLTPASLKLYDKTVPPLEDALKKGDDEFEKVQKTVS